VSGLNGRLLPPAHCRDCRIDPDAAAGDDFSFIRPVRVFAGPGRQRWDPDFLRARFPSAVQTDDRPGAPRDNIYWTANVAEAGHFIYRYESVWLPAALLTADRQNTLADALFATSRIWPMELHFQKALAGAPPEAIAATLDTATNPAVLDAFVFVIIGSEGAPAYPGLPGYSPDLANARHDAAEVAKAMAELRKIVPEAGSYLAETSYFERDWQKAFWGHWPDLGSMEGPATSPMMASPGGLRGIARKWRPIFGLWVSPTSLR
jgi:hypothetical protein